MRKLMIVDIELAEGRGATEGYELRIKNLEHAVESMKNVDASRWNNPVLCIAAEGEFDADAYPTFRVEDRVIAIPGGFGGYGNLYAENAEENLKFAEEVLSLVVFEKVQVNQLVNENELARFLLTERWPVPEEARYFKISDTGMDVLFERVKGLRDVEWAPVLYYTSGQWCVTVKMEPKRCNFELWGRITINPTLATFIIETFSLGKVYKIPTTDELDASHCMHTDEPDIENVAELKEWWEEEGKEIFEQKE